MRAGSLKHRVDIQKLSHGRDEYGEALEEWTSYVKAHAAVESLHGREFFAAQQVNSQTTTRVRMRPCRGARFDSKMRIVVDGGRTFDIQAVIEDWNGGREVAFMCPEVNGYVH